VPHPDRVEATDVSRSSSALGGLHRPDTGCALDAHRWRGPPVSQQPSRRRSMAPPLPSGWRFPWLAAGWRGSRLPHAVISLARRPQRADTRRL